MWQKIKNFYHLLVAVLANLIFWFPAKKLIVIGVTGTDGKTTTVNLIYHILKSCGKSVSMISSISAVIDGKTFDTGFHVTTPSSFSLQKFIRRAVNAKSKYFVLEVTSHALDQNRAFAIPFEVGVLTNITHEHLDYHKTYENYVKTKAILLKISKIAIVNKDDQSYRLISNFKFLRTKLITYGLKNNSDVNPGNFPFKTTLIGEFNRYNVLAAISACRALGIGDRAIAEGIESFVPPTGRADIVFKKDFTVMIDFAHTPNSIEQILKSVRPIVRGKIIHVFGSAGLRDEAKRPVMGKNSAQYADILILTAEDPRSESVDQINRQIESGIINKKIKILKISDRKEAIEKAIKMAKKGDFVLITGKSHEKSMNYGHGEVSWDEYAVTREALENK